MQKLVRKDGDIGRKLGTFTEIGDTLSNGESGAVLDIHAQTSSSGIAASNSECRKLWMLLFIGIANSREA